MTVIYVDRVFALNMLVDYLLLLSAARLAGIPLHRRRLMLCAGWGGVYACAIFFPKLQWLAHPLMKLAAGLSVACLAYWQERRRFRLIVLFLLLSGGLAGVLLGLGYAAGAPEVYLGRLYAARISWPILLLSAVIFSILLPLIFQQGARHGGGEIMEILISIGGKHQTIHALYDTGNTLRDPAAGRPVLVVEQQALGEVLCPEIRSVLNAAIPPEEKMARLCKQDTGYRFTLLPYCSVGVPSGLLLAVWSDYIEVQGRRCARTLLALSPGPVSDGGGYQALWGAEERRERHEMAANASDLAEKTRQAG